MTDSPRRKIKNITILDVARESGVSYATVSRVLSGFAFVKEATHTRVLEVADRLGYVAKSDALYYPSASWAGKKLCQYYRQRSD